VPTGEEERSVTTVAVPDHHAVDPWVTIDRAAVAGCAVLLPPTVVARMSLTHTELVEKANGVVRREWATTETAP
jgi:hypothetical protein